jgi:predicted O-linked N-acetylglucosamine transferase (SPINDLY family)
MGDYFPARVAASILTAIGLSELITHNLEDYEKLALSLASDPARLAALREKLEVNRKTMPLFDTARFTRNLEAGYETMRQNFLK